MRPTEAKRAQQKAADEELLERGGRRSCTREEEQEFRKEFFLSFVSLETGRPPVEKTSVARESVTGE